MAIIVFDWLLSQLCQISYPFYRESHWQSVNSVTGSATEITEFRGLVADGGLSVQFIHIGGSLDAAILTITKLQPNSISLACRTEFSIIRYNHCWFRQYAVSSVGMYTCMYIQL